MLRYDFGVLSILTGVNNSRIGALSLGFTHIGGDWYEDDSYECSAYSMDNRILSATFARRFGPWVAVGAAVKWIWIDDYFDDGQGTVCDAGLLFMPGIGSSTGNPEDGLKIGISKANLMIKQIEFEYDYETQRYRIPSVLRTGFSFIPVSRRPTG